MPADPTPSHNNIVTPNIDVKNTQRGVATLVMTDLVESTRLVEELGDTKAADMIREHDRMARGILQSCGGTEIDKSDGFLFYFLDQNSALQFALDYQRALADIRTNTGLALYSRVGIHYGDVVTYWNREEDVKRGAKPLEIEGLAKLVAARIMSLAEGNQILLSGTAYDLIHRPFNDQCAHRYHDLTWLSHGTYSLKGVDKHYDVYEVGEQKLAQLKTPKDAPKAKRVKTGFSTPLSIALLPITAVLAIVLTLWIVNYHPFSTDFTFTQQDFIVLGQFKNETSDPIFDNSLTQAFKVGFQQSTYTKLVSDQRIKDTLNRMKLGQDATATSLILDRNIGSQVSLREQAKALVLGKISEFAGGYLLIVEVIDPNTGRTVFSDTRQASQDQILNSLDELIVQVREQLGESLESIEANNLPLARVTTANFTALKAYSQGIEEYGKARFKQAQLLYETAVKYDPEFAMAWAKLGIVEFQRSPSTPENALDLMKKALSFKDRLTDREKIYVEGSINWYGNPEDMERSWFLLSSLYSDTMAGPQNLGIVSRSYFNDYNQAIEAFTQATKISSDGRVAISYHDLGYSYLAKNEYELAKQAFDESWKIGRPVNPVYGGMIDYYTTIGEYDNAQSYTESLNQKEIPPAIYLRSLTRLADSYFFQGQFEKSQIQYQAIENQSKDQGAISVYYRALLAQLATLQQFGAKDIFQERLAQLILEEKTSYSNTTVEGMNAHASIHLPFLAIIAARAGLTDIALDVEQFLDSAPGKVNNISLAGAYFDMLKGERFINEGQYLEAIRLIRPYTNSGRLEIFQAHVSLARAYQLNNQLDLAINEYLWVSENKGRAFAEWVDEFYGKQFNLIDWCNSWINLAKIYAEKKQTGKAITSLEAFIDHWRNADQDTPLLIEAKNLLTKFKATNG